VLCFCVCFQCIRTSDHPVSSRVAIFTLLRVLTQNAGQYISYGFFIDGDSHGLCRLCHRHPQSFRTISVASSIYSDRRQRAFLRDSLQFQHRTPPDGPRYVVVRASSMDYCRVVSTVSRSASLPGASSSSQWRKSRGGQRGHVPPKEKMSNGGTVIHHVLPKYGADSALVSAGQ